MTLRDSIVMSFPPLLRHAYACVRAVDCLLIPIAFCLRHDVERDIRIAVTSAKQRVLDSSLITSGEGVVAFEMPLTACLFDVPLASSCDGVQYGVGLLPPPVYRNAWWVVCAQAFL
jgi:hypothetical protein